MKVEGLGSIQKLEDKPNNRCRKWRLRVSTGINPKTGNYQERTKRFTGTIKEAKAELAIFAAEVQSEIAVSADRRKITVEQLSEEWIKERVSLKLIAQATADKNTCTMATFNYQLGKIRADKLTTKHVVDAMGALMEGDSPSGKPLSSIYINTVLTTANQMYKWAIERGLCARNPIVDVPKPKVEDTVRDALSPEQITDLLEKCPPNNYHHVGVALALLAGLREGECANLLWSDVDFENRAMLVRGTKNTSSFAYIPILDELYDYLLAWKECQTEQLESHDLEFDESMTVLTDPFGFALTGKGLGKWWRMHRKELGFSQFRFHDLRHSFATMLARNKIHPKIIADLMRHSNEKMALKIYTHLNIDDQREALANVKIG